MNRIHVDHAKCQGHALCNGVDEATFPVDDLGFSAVHDVTTDTDVELIDRATRLCPERAISYTELDESL